MALNENQAADFAKNLLLAMAQSGSLKVLGEPTGSTPSDERSENRGRRDGIYLAALHRELVKHLQK